MIVKELDDGVVVRRIVEPADAAQWRPGFIGAYQTVFSGFPYHERFYPSEAEGVFNKLLDTPENIVLLATQGDDRVLGFSAAIPLRFKPAVANQVTGLVPLRHTFYLAELGVLPQYRGNQIGRTLVRERIRLIDRDQFTHVLLRISANNTPSGEMYKAMGFVDMGVHMDVTTMRTDGQVRSDRRLFLSRVLSQVGLNE